MVRCLILNLLASSVVAIALITLVVASVPANVVDDLFNALPRLQSHRLDIDHMEKSRPSVGSPWRGGGGDSWTPATANEVSLATLPAQFGPKHGDGSSCKFEWKHGCVGHARSYTSQQRVPADAVSRALRVHRDSSKEGVEVDALEHLYTLLRHTISKPPCSLRFLGDSISADSFAAAVMGAHRLGYHRVSWCLWAAGGLDYWQNDNVSLTVFCSSIFKLMSQVNFLPPDGSELHPECSELSITQMSDDPIQPLSEYVHRSTYTIVNVGVHANDAKSYSQLLRGYVLPLWNGLSDEERLGKVLWRETLPQHWSEEGTYALRRENDFGKCVPTKNISHAMWRNDHFDTWAQFHNMSQLRIARAFDAFLGRHDLHATGDCTHFLYSPFTWQHVWAGVVEVLSIAA